MWFPRGFGTSRRADLLPLDSLRSEWYLRAFRRGCDYGGSGQVLRAALWYHAVRLRCHHAMVARRLLRLQFCVWVPAAVTRPGIPVPGLSVCALPSSLHPGPTPPPPPFQGERAGGSRAVEIGVCSDARFGIWLEVVGGTAWQQFWGAAEAYLLASRAVRHCGGHGQVSLASPWAQEVCRRCIRRTVCLQSGLPTPPGM